MVAADLGVGFVPEEFLQSEDVNKIDLKEKIPERNIVLIKRKEQPLSVAAKELERLIEECWTAFPKVACRKFGTLN